MNERNRYGAPMRGVPDNVREKIGTRREIPRARAERLAQEAQAQAARERGAEVEVQDPWEARRKELADRGDIFDTKGNITRNGEAMLRASGWSTDQILRMEEMQKNDAGEVMVISEEPPASQRLSSNRRAQIGKNAEQAAANELARRQREENEAARLRDQARREAEGARAMAGAREYARVLRETGSTSMAEQARARAERDFDNQYGNGKAA